MFRLLIAIAVILYFSLFFVIVSKQRIGKIIPLTYVFLAFVFFVASLIGSLSYFKYLLVACAIFSCSYILLMYFRRKIDIKEMLDNYFRPSLFIYLLFFVYLYLVLGNVELSNIDDLNFWGIKLLDMMRTDKLYTTTEYAVYGVTQYPPFPFLLEGAFIKLFGTVDQSYSMLAIGSFSFSFFLPIIDQFENGLKGFLKSLMVFAISVLTTLMVQKNYSMAYDSFIYNSLYVDWILSIVLAYGMSVLYNFNSESKFDYFQMAICSLVLIMTKQIGMALMLLLWVMTYVYLALENHKIIIKRKQLLYFVLFVIGIPMFVYLVWKVQIGQFSQISVVSEITDGIGEVISPESVDRASFYTWFIARFVSAYFNTPIILRPIEISYFWLTLIATAVLLFIGKLRKESIDYYTIPVFYFLGSIGYALGIMLSYMFVFGSEGETMVMFGRYMQTYTYAGFVLVIYILMRGNFSFKKSLLIFVISLLLVEPASIKTICYIKDRENYRDNQVPYIKNYLDNEYNYQNMVVFNQTDIKYKALFKYLAQEKNRNIEYAQVLDETSFENFLIFFKDKELVYIGDYDKRFLKYWDMITDVEPYNSSLYRIVKEADGYDFELIYTWDDV